MVQWGVAQADSTARETLMFSPTRFVVKQAELDSRLNKERKAGNVAAMQSALKELTYLYRSYYGHPEIQDASL